MIDAGHPVAFGPCVEPWQEEDFRALDPAWLVLAGLEQEAPVRRAYIERPRGHAKTSDLAIQVTWLLAFSPRPVQGLAAAADQEQAGLIRAAMQRLGQLNPWVAKERLKYPQHAVVNARTGSKLDIIASDVASSWGSLPDFVICDELCHWDKVELWHSLFSAAAKRPSCVLVILTNAGQGHGWHWQVREEARQNPAWYFRSLRGPCARWIGEAALAEQRALLPPAVYARLWLNQWQETGGCFVTWAEAEACRDPSLAPREAGMPGWQYVAAVDYAEKHDYTVGVIVHWEGDGLVVDRMDAVRPGPDRPTPVSWVEAWMQQTAAAFGNVTFVIDEYQLLSVIQRLEDRFAIHRFEFKGGRGNHALAANLRSLILARRVRWYAGCGELASGDYTGGAADRGELAPGESPGAKWEGTVPWPLVGEGSVGGNEPLPHPHPALPHQGGGSHGRDDLETELASVVVREAGSGGRWRIDHLPGADHHDDRVFALGAACLYAVENRGSGWMEVTPPGPSGGLAW